MAVYDLKIAIILVFPCLQISSRDGCVDTKQSHHSSFLFPETTKNFDTLPLEFQVCSYEYIQRSY